MSHKLNTRADGAAKMQEQMSAACRDALPMLQELKNRSLKAWQEFVPNNPSYPVKAELEALLTYVASVAELPIKECKA